MKKRNTSQIIRIIGYIMLMGALVYSAAQVSTTSAFFILGCGSAMFLHLLEQ